MVPVVMFAALDKLVAVVAVPVKSAMMVLGVVMVTIPLPTSDTLRFPKLMFPTTPLKVSSS